MRLYYDFLIEMGVNKELANSAFNAILGALVMMLVVTIYKGYLFYSRKKQIHEEERNTETLGKLIEECWNEKEFYILYVVFFLIFTIVNYVFFTKL